jgi:hypothetical protein
MFSERFSRISRRQFRRELVGVKSKGLFPDSSEKDADEGQFAHFNDSDGNEVTI